VPLAICHGRANEAELEPPTQQADAATLHLLSHFQPAEIVSLLHNKTTRSTPSTNNAVGLEVVTVSTQHPVERASLIESLL
jgi:hypothetical protein